MIKKILIFNTLIIILLLFTGCNKIDSLFINGGLVEKTLYVGDKMYLTTNAYSNKNVNWESTDITIVTVDENGLVEAISAGEANIIATMDNYSNVTTIKVLDNIDAFKIKISGKQTVLINETIKLNASYKNDEDQFVWKSSDESIATIDQTGTIKGIFPGVVTITASLVDDNTISSEIIVLVRTGNGVQDVINNYINQQTHITVGNLDLKQLSSTVVNLVKDVEKSVIGVTSHENTDGTISSALGVGTGGIFKKEVTSNGYKYSVFTNYHVIEDSDYVKVYLGDLDEYVNAEVVKYDKDVDIALITFEHKQEYDILEFATDDLHAGDFVIAIGHPGGFNYYGTVTFGMVSYPKRIKGNSNVIYVQHDTPINPGNSGGPLFNLDGKVVGINTLKIATTNTEGLGFSIALENFLEYIFN